jgi:outer membrane receptor protein involved in Fe transport
MKLFRSTSATLLVLLFAITAFATSSANYQGVRAEGVVLDSARAPIANATVFFSVAGRRVAETQTTPSGHFILPTVPASGVLSVEAQGFARLDREWPTAAGNPLELILYPAGVHEQVTVTATGTEMKLGDIAASIRVLSSSDLSTTGALAIDDALRQVAGFQLFRRSGSRTANPTSQGVSLRGVGASGASRAVVLADGIPLNDPFGGWVYWSRVPKESISRIEVLRGSASDLYGSGALGGVINVLTKRPTAPALSLEISYGNQNTPDGSLFMGTRRGRWSASVSGESFKTGGYIVVATPERGPVDTPATSRHAALDFKLQFDQTKNARFFVGGSYFGESRGNGTPLQINRTHIRQITAGAEWESRRIGTLGLRAYGSTEVFDQNFSAIAADRQSETLTRLQRVPAQVAGVSVQWSRALGEKHTLVSGFEAREVRGASDEIVFVQGKPSSLVGAGGRERDTGLYVKDFFRVTPRLSVVAGARLDRWRNFAAHADTRGLAANAAPNITSFPDRSETAVSPQLSLVYKPVEKISLFASAYRAFRAPTLNELYRSFRVGNILTLANDKLVAERLRGGEGGAGFTSREGNLSVRGLFFWTETSRSVANVTLNVAPNLITRERRNLGRTRSRGIEVESEIRVGQRWAITGGYLFANARVLDFPADTALEGLSIPQVARHNLALQLRYVKSSQLSFGLQGRIVGVQFDDDLNLFRLPGYFTLDALVSRPLTRNVEVFAAAENFLNQRYLVGRTPVTNLGPPALLRAGIRLRFGRR